MLSHLANNAKGTPLTVRLAMHHRFSSGIRWVGRLKHCSVDVKDAYAKSYRDWFRGSAARGQSAAKQLDALCLMRTPKTSQFMEQIL
ncbi:hypothetical protein MRB53_039113 [Persea americana]|nr:hypothetical protein MRB53_039113 [Persea americana]